MLMGSWEELTFRVVFAVESETSTKVSCDRSREGREVEPEALEPGQGGERAQQPHGPLPESMSSLVKYL